MPTPLGRYCVRSRLDTRGRAGYALIMKRHSGKISVWLVFILAAIVLAYFAKDFLVGFIQCQAMGVACGMGG